MNGGDRQQLSMPNEKSIIQLFKQTMKTLTEGISTAAALGGDGFLDLENQKDVDTDQPLGNVFLTDGPAVMKTLQQEQTRSLQRPEKKLVSLGSNEQGEEEL